MAGTPTENSAQSPLPAPGDSAACGSGCDCQKNSGNTLAKLLVCTLVLFAASGVLHLQSGGEKFGICIGDEVCRQNREPMPLSSRWTH